jgi:hypothetical protein
MKIKIEGVEYDVAELGRLSLLDLLELKKQTGLDVDQLQSIFAEAQPEEGKEPENILNSEEGLVAFGALIWLSRRKAGERSLTFEQACDFPLESLEFIEEADDPAPVPSP